MNQKMNRDDVALLIAGKGENHKKLQHKIDFGVESTSKIAGFSIRYKRNLKGGRLLCISLFKRRTWNVSS